MIFWQQIKLQNKTHISCMRDRTLGIISHKVAWGYSIHLFESRTKNWKHTLTVEQEALLGHLLVKKIPVTYKLSSIKIPEYLSQKQIQGHQKLQMHRMTPNRPWTLNSQKYSAGTKYLWGQNFGPFCSIITAFRDIMSLKLGNAPNDPKLNLNT